MDSILKGEKQFEFRRTSFKRDVDVIVMYATSPVQQVVGEFDVARILDDNPLALWQQTKAAAGIDEAGFFNYFSGKDKGYAIRIGQVRPYEEPLDLDKHFGIRPPQSFVYLDFQWPSRG